MTKQETLVKLAEQMDCSFSKDQVIKMIEAIEETTKPEKESIERFSILVDQIAEDLSHLGTRMIDYYELCMSSTHEVELDAIYFDESEIAECVRGTIKQYYEEQNENN